MLDLSKLLWTNINKKASLPWDQTTNNQEQETKNILNNNMVNDFNQSQLDSSTQNFWNNQQVNQWQNRVWQYFQSINDWLNKLWTYKWVFSPMQQRKIAQLYNNARNKYKTSSQSEEETNAFNAIKNNPIWKKFNK